MGRMDLDIKFMKIAIREAKKGLGRTSPNPAVGAVIVKDGKVLSKGYHRKAGLPHAEIEALNKLGGKAPGCTMYVTLEPCNHFGKTPPCTEAILESGIIRVVVGMKDPNRGVKGGGVDYLRRKGIQTDVGILEEECKRINEAFIKFVTTNQPFVNLKSALTMDGWIGTRTGHSKWITNEASRRFVHRLRDEVDGVLVGVGTVLADDPSLTVRTKNTSKQPLRIILDTNLKSPLNAKVFTQYDPSNTIVVVGESMDKAEKVDTLRSRGVRIQKCEVKDGKINLKFLMKILAGMSVTNILVEGGAGVAGSFLREKLVDKFFIFKAPKLLGGGDGIPMSRGEGPRHMDDCLKLRNIRVRRFGEDILIIAYPVY